MKTAFGTLVVFLFATYASSFEIYGVDFGDILTIVGNITDGDKIEALCRGILPPVECPKQSLRNFYKRDDDRDYEGLVNGIIHEGKQAYVSAIHQLELQEESKAVALKEIREVFNVVEIEKECACAPAQEICIREVTTKINAAFNTFYIKLNECTVIATAQWQDYINWIKSILLDIFCKGRDIIERDGKCKKCEKKEELGWCRYFLYLAYVKYMEDVKCSKETIKKIVVQLESVNISFQGCIDPYLKELIANIKVLREDIEKCKKIN